MKLSKVKPNKKTEPQDGPYCLKDKAFCYLSQPMVRRWSTYEWFYSAIDYPGLLKRNSWSTCIILLGKPRRFSTNFLHEERDELSQYRESVRKHYTELRSGTREGLPTDLARPLAVGQRVIAIHPKSRQVHDESVLTVDHDKSRVQFGRPDLGVTFVKDIDCMPSNLLDNMPEALRRENSALYRLSMNSREPRSLMLPTLSEANPLIAMMNQ
ncbi:putative protein LIN-9/Protein ALWAYS EARLY, DIRP [Helianthus debilis subsp. tardiflorus]